MSSGTTLTKATTPCLPATAATLPYSYGSAVSLDPASLSSVPDPIAVAEIKRLIPKIPMRGHCKDVWAMLEILKADGKGVISLNQKEQLARLTQEAEASGGDSLTCPTIGAEFDALLQTLTDSGLM
jgi:hypothetical protein